MRRLVVVLALVGMGMLAHASPALAAVPWCGNDALSTDRPDTVGGRKVHVVYAIPADGIDRFAEKASAITTDLGAITDWWHREDPLRAPRWDLFAFPGCPGGAAALDLTFLRLPRGADAYFLHANRLAAIADDLAPTFGDAAKKYVVFYDGPVADENVCGSAFGRERPLEGGRFAVGAVYLQARPGFPGCGDLGVAGYVASTTAHELLHMLGAVPPGAPHACPDSLAHDCDSQPDVMRSGGFSSQLVDYLLDVGHDDYYGHSGAWLDVQDSPWLAGPLPDHPLTVELVGAHAGTSVRSLLTGIDCPAVCSIPWPHDDTVTLLDEAGDADRFLRWEGACAGELVCELAMDGDKAVRAVFGPATYRLTMRVVGVGAGVGAGRIRSNVRPACRTTCRANVGADEVVTLRAIPARGWRFAAWRGCRPQAKPTCRVKMARNMTVSAVFRR